MHHGGRLTLHVTTIITRRLDRSEATSVLWIVTGHRGVVGRGLLSLPLLVSRLDHRVVRLIIVVLGLHGAANSLIRSHVVPHISIVSVAAGTCADRRLEEGALGGTRALILRIVEGSVVLGVRRASRARCDTSDARRVRRIAIFSLDWLDNRTRVQN